MTLKLPKPDLVFGKIQLKLTNKCQRFKPAIVATVRVRNIGKVASPAKMNVGMVNAKDMHPVGWGNGKGFKSIRAGHYIIVTFPIFYLVANPGHIPGTHTFKFRLNSAKWIKESNYNNNSHHTSITIPRGYCKPRLGLTFKKPDLIPILFKPMTGKVAVRNIGAANAGKSLLLIKCSAAQAGGCAENTAMSPYINPAYPNYVVVKIPALAPGQVYSHILKFWKSLKWKKGKYRFIAKADGSNIIAESNEGNNTTFSWLAK